MGSFTSLLSSQLNNSDGSYARVDAVMSASGTYNNTGNDATTGDTLTAATFGLASIINVVLSEDSGYAFEALGLDSGPASSCRIKIYQGASGTTGATSGGTPAGTNSTSAVTGTAEAQTFTGTASTTGEITAFSGTGQSSAGQVITTTDNQTMSLNECAGMWFVSATHGPYYIVSNTEVSGAQAVLTVIGDAPTTDAGEYRIVKAPTPVGTNGASASLTATAAAQTFTGSALATHTHSIGAAAGGEVPNGTDLTTALAAVKVTVVGY